MTVTDIVEQNYVGDIVLYEEPHFHSREVGTILSGQGVLKRGTVLGEVLVGAISAAAKGGGNTGNGTCGTLAAQPKAIQGVYKAIVEIAGTNAATWNLYDPNGKLIDQKQYSGSGQAAVFANDQIHATITDGSTDFVVGDEFDITLAAPSLKYIKSVDGALDGSNPGAAVLLQNIDATSADVVGAVILVRNAIVSEPALIFDASITDSTKRGVVEAGLTAKGIKITSGA